MMDSVSANGGRAAEMAKKVEVFCGLAKLCIDFRLISSYHKYAMILYNVRDYARLYFDRTYNG